MNTSCIKVINAMIKEKEYSILKGKDYLREYSQFFTDQRVVNFMVNWTCKGAQNVLDPAVGNNIFLKTSKKLFPKINVNGYEVDKTILDFFNNIAGYNIINEDYLSSEWTKKYDAIVCNPPYKKFQLIANREELLKNILINTNIHLSGYTNLYVYFFIKSIFQLSNKGRLSYIIPSEFLNSKYGNVVKDFLIAHKLIYAIFNIEDDRELFDGVTTTSCIILINKIKKNTIKFYNIKSVDELMDIDVDNDNTVPFTVKYSDIKSEDKWRDYLCNNKQTVKFKNLKYVSDFCRVARGIATGANDYFCLSKNKIESYKIPNECVEECICKSEDVHSMFFKRQDLCNLHNDNKFVHILNTKVDNVYKVLKYIKFGEILGVKDKYIPSHRKNWYSVEQKKSAPIWVSSAFRGKIKFVRNLVGAKNLTTFHSVFVNNNYTNDTNLIFSYFITPMAQKILCKNRKKMGNGLNKFQPNDLNNAQMLDISIISIDDKNKIENLYNKLQLEYNWDLIMELETIFAKYLLA